MIETGEIAVYAVANEVVASYEGYVADNRDGLSFARRGMSREELAAEVGAEVADRCAAEAAAMGKARFDELILKAVDRYIYRIW